MGDIVNLRQVRKSRMRAAAQAQAQVNRLQSGRTKADRTAAAETQARQERRLDGHQIAAAAPEDG